MLVNEQGRDPRGMGCEDAGTDRGEVLSYSVL
jgi:hypothetical protein